MYDYENLTRCLFKPRNNATEFLTFYFCIINCQLVYFRLCIRKSIA